MVSEIEHDPIHELAIAGRKVLQDKPKSAHNDDASGTVASESGAAYDWMGHCLPFNVCEW